MNHLADSIEMEEQRKRTLQNGLLAFLKKDPTHPLYERHIGDMRMISEKDRKYIELL